MDKTLFLCILVIPQLLVNPHHGQASDTTTLAPAMFLFGDSLTDSGNNNYIPTMARANYFPYGIDFGYPTGRFCNGLTAVDFAGTLRYNTHIHMSSYLERMPKSRMFPHLTSL